ncbi:hypothetical protein EJ04DRAFT_563201 [Polyplosphaeria fusca]|uniref:Uncharacterized protein n=1 Tax=Polyplosphaeria fusca TaxID=682080 RepID=A0A9P4QZE8_9PLEO|nr:hypothetical protein EJ04DRAFT_563201 [Polyplosphaeria fusca]
MASQNGNISQLGKRKSCSSPTTDDQNDRTPQRPKSQHRPPARLAMAKRTYHNYLQLKNTKDTGIILGFETFLDAFPGDYWLGSIHGDQIHAAITRAELDAEQRETPEALHNREGLDTEIRRMYTWRLMRIIHEDMRQYKSSGFYDGPPLGCTQRDVGPGLLRGDRRAREMVRGYVEVLEGSGHAEREEQRARLEKLVRVTGMMDDVE